MRNSFFLVFLFFFVPFTLLSQVHFDLFIKDKKVGELKVSRVSQNDIVTYQLESLTSVSMFGQVDIEVNAKCIFSSSGILTESRFLNYINKNETVNSKVILDHGKYTGKRNDKIIPIKENAINFCTTNLFWTEPAKTVKKVFSENQLKTLELSSAGPHTYSLALLDGQVNTYEYKKGQLFKAVLNHKLYEITVLPKPIKQPVSKEK